MEQIVATHYAIRPTWIPAEDWKDARPGRCDQFDRAHYIFDKSLAKTAGRMVGEAIALSNSFPIPVLPVPFLLVLSSPFPHEYAPPMMTVIFISLSLIEGAYHSSSCLPFLPGAPEKWAALIACPF